MNTRNVISPPLALVLIVSLLILSFSSNSIASKKVLYLDQGWSAEQRQKFYETPQGSYLIPYNWYLALEQADENALFSNRQNIKKYNYLLKQEIDGSVLDVPLGFAIEPAPGEEDWLGYSCAACHTNEIRYKGKRIRIDGAPSLGDFVGFVSGLHDAIIATLKDDEKFERFANRVIESYDPLAKSVLLTELTNYADQSSAFFKRNYSETKSGYGRLDAFGYIMNELFADDLGVPENANEPNAPVSYPFLWGTPSHDFVQWNGGADNPIGRNVGEVLGTFGRVNLTNLEFLGSTSARGKELIFLENLLTQLKAPYWPGELLGKIDSEMASNGKVLYEQTRGDEPSCAYCHSLKNSAGVYPLTPAEENLFGAQFIKTSMIPLETIGTDPTSSLNFATRISSTGHLAPFLPEPFTGAAELPAPFLLGILVGLATESSLETIQPPLTQIEFASAIGFRVAAPGFPPQQPQNILAYRARPLDGIWATAPYLHNGSVQNLHELLKPGSKRKSKFYVGDMKFDAKRIGFKSKNKGNTSLLDTSLPSNSNLGHEYGTTLSKKEKWELIEFLKTL